jgi:hypothetical protein
MFIMLLEGVTNLHSHFHLKRSRCYKRLFMTATKSFPIIISISNENDCDGFLPPQEA